MGAPTVDDRVFRRFVVRVRRPDGGSGSGVLIAPGRVLTCAHVVGAAGEVTIELDPHARVAGSYAEDDRLLAGAVTHMSTPRGESATEFWPFPDLALIRMDREDHIFAPLGAEPLAAVRDGIHAWGFGRREDAVASPGMSAAYRWVGHDGDGTLRLHAGDAPAGLSGAPVVASRGGIFGLLSVARDPNEPRGGWASPVTALRELPPCAPDAGSAESVWDHNQRHCWLHREVWARATMAGAEDSLERPWEWLRFDPAQDAPSTALLPEYRLVPLVGREQVVADLVDWCRGPAEVSIGTIQDVGGTGKTRLAVEVGQALARAGWTTGFLRRDSSPPPSRGPRLVIVDYASEHDPTERNQAFERLIGSASAMEPVRLLLLDRGHPADATLVDSLRSSGVGATLKHNLGRAVTLTGATAALDLHQRRELHRKAFLAFGGAPATAPPVPDLSGSRYSRPLDVVIAAYDTAIVGDSGSVGAFDRVLDHELTHWRRRAARLGIPDEVVLPALAVVTLCGARDDQEAQRLLDVLAVDRSLRDRLDTLVHGTYPGSWVWNPLRPDRLGEALIRRWLEVHGATARELVGTLEPAVTTAQLARIFTVAARLPAEHAAPFLAILKSRRRSLSTRMSRHRPRPPTGGAGDRENRAPAADPYAGELVAALGRIVPQLTRERRSGGQPPGGDGGFASFLNVLGERLKDFGLVAAAEEAADLARRMCEDEQDHEGSEVQRDLATSLTILGDLSRDRSEASAEELYRRSIDIRHALLERHPEDARVQRDLATSYLKLADLAKVTVGSDAAKLLYERALDVSQGLVQRDPDNDTYRRDLLVVRARLGDLALSVGDVDAADRLHRSDHDLIQSLAEHDPTSARYKRDLAFSCTRIGDLAQSGGDRRASEQHYEKSLTLRRDLVEEEPLRTGYQRDLSVSYDKVGDLARDRGDLDAAHAYYRHALDISVRLADQDPGNRRYQRDVSVSYDKLGNIAWDRGDLEAAEAHYRRSFEIIGRLVDLAPGNIAYQRDLAFSYDRQGDLARAAGDPAGAARFYTDCLDVRTRLAERDPGNGKHQRDLWITYGKLGDLALDDGDVDAARPLYRQSAQIARRLADRSPGNSAYQHDLTSCFARLGNLARADGDLDAARRDYAGGVDILRRLVERDPHDPRYRNDLMSWCDEFGDLAAADGDLEAARAFHGISHDSRRWLAEQEPGNRDYQFKVALSYAKLAAHATAEGDWEASRRLSLHRLEIARELVAAEPGNSAYGVELADGYGDLGDVAQTTGDTRAARIWYERALDLRRELAEREPGDVSHRQNLHVSCTQLGDLARVDGDLDLARDFYQEGLDIARHLAEESSGTSDHETGLAIALERLGFLARLEGDLATAWTLHRQECEVNQSLVARHPQNLSHRDSLAFSYALLAAVAMASGDRLRGAELMAQARTIREDLVAAAPQTVAYRVELARVYLALALTDATHDAPWAGRIRSLLEPLAAEGRLSHDGREILDCARDRP